MCDDCTALSTTPHHTLPSRRSLILGAVAAAGVLAAGLRPTTAAPPHPQVDAVRALAFRNLHTGEELRATYWEGGRYQPDALAEINRVLRDHRTGDVATMEPALLDLLHRLHRAMDAGQPFHVISGYRSPKSNAALAARSTGVARKSFHMAGMAIDVRLPGRPLKSLHKAALALGGGGVGYYPKSDFIHVDIGPVRRW